MEGFRDDLSYPRRDASATVAPCADRALNPYEPPQLAPAADLPQAAARTIDRIVLFAWPVLFALNLPVPLLFAWDLTEDNGRFGMLCSCFLWLIAGWAACLVWPHEGRRFIVGAILLAMSQVFPVIQVFSGFVAFAVAQKLGLVGQSLKLPSEGAAFFITAVVGAVLLMAAGILGLGISLLLPRRWFQRLARSSVMT